MKNPKYIQQDRSVKLYQEDAIRFLSQLDAGSVDVLVTDPAYSGMNQHLQLGRGRIVGVYQEKERSGKWFKEFHDSPENYEAFLQAAYTCLRDDGHIYLMFDSYSLLTLAPLVRNYFEVKNLITWDKVAIGMGHYFRRRHEFIIFATKKAKRKISQRNIPDVWRFKRIARAPYPTQKPVEVFQAMILASSQPGAVICDPFLGSGSSAIAAIKMNCRFVGSDISTQALNISKSRIDQFINSGIDPLQPKSALAEKEDYGWFMNGQP